MVIMNQISIERVSAQAREIRFGRTLLTLLATVLYCVGWITAKTWIWLWFALCWSAVAIKVGWTDARSTSGGPPRESH